jgi:phosphonate dehydrogenase
MVDRRFISTLKPGAFLINIARGSLVNESDVAQAVESGRLGGYAADVYEFEDAALAPGSVEVHSGLVALRNKTILTPHLGSAVTSVRRRIERDAALNIVEALSGRRPHGAVNPPSFSGET